MIPLFASEGAFATMRIKHSPVSRVIVVILAVVFCVSSYHGSISAAERAPHPTLPAGKNGQAETGEEASGGAPLPWQPLTAIIGTRQRHKVATGETLLDIARLYDLGYNELEDLYPAVDPWRLPEGAEMTIPARKILPDPVVRGIVINVPEMRLYYYDVIGDRPMVTTFPIGIGATDFPTPVGSFAVTSKRVHPTWFIPPSLQAKYRGITSVPPGPNNPLGDYWMRLGDSMYGIHSTNFPWSVGRMATHGCIRMYPEDMERFFPIVQPGTRVQLVYQPVKVAVVDARIHIEVHRDVYGKKGDLRRYSQTLLIDKGLAGRVDRRRLDRAVREHTGMPVEITLGSAPSIPSMRSPDTGRIRVKPLEFVHQRSAD